MITFTAPEIQHYCEMLSHRSSTNFNNPAVFDARTYQILDTIFDNIKQIMPREGTTDVWDLWFHASRGPIEKLGDYQEWLEDREVSSYEEFREIWLSCFPDKEYWYPFTAIERQENQYREIFLSRRTVIEQKGAPSAGVPLDIHEFAEWLLWSVDACIDALKEMSANDYFRACAIGYAANHYSGGDRTPREQYDLHADGRDGGLGEIDPDSPSAFLSWFTGQYDGHPWEVVRGGNSTHISLYPQHNEDGFTFLLDGSSVSRTIETVRFCLALRKAGLPVYIRDGSILADRLTGNEKIGIVPQGIVPVYCESLFPGERIISFMNLDCEKLGEVVRHCTWQPIPQTRLQNS